jgi:hypothetical protein
MGPRDKVQALQRPTSRGIFAREDKPAPAVARGLAGEQMRI